MAQIEALGARAQNTVARVRMAILNQQPTKVVPQVSAARLAELCGLTRGQLNHRITKGDLPPGSVNEAGSRRMFSVNEAFDWCRDYRLHRLRPTGQRGVVLTVANFKGGVSKTTTAAILAQGLCLRGHRVLAIDLDPQASLTTLFGFLPTVDVGEEATAYDVFVGGADASENLLPNVRQTYWPNLDLVGANPLLYTAEFAIPARVQPQSHAELRERYNQRMAQLKPGDRPPLAPMDIQALLANALHEARDEYDVIVIDTPPALGYLTLNALWAADGLLVPLPPSGMDFASLAHFWSLLADFGKFFTQPKELEFLHVLLSKVNYTDDPASESVRNWVISDYGPYLLPVEIPKNRYAPGTAAEFGTVFDMQADSVSETTLRRTMQPYESLIGMVEASICNTWRSRQADGSAA